MLEVGEFFTMKTLIEIKELLNIEVVYSIDGKGQWAIIGKSKAQIDVRAGPKIEVQIKAVTVAYGRVQIPEVRIETLDRKILDPKYIVKERGNSQIILVQPRSIEMVPAVH